MVTMSQWPLFYMQNSVIFYYICIKNIIVLDLETKSSAQDKIMSTEGDGGGGIIKSVTFTVNCQVGIFPCISL